MARTMVFIDHMNFEIAVKNLFGKLENPQEPPRLDYNQLPLRITAEVSRAELLKTFLFIPKPDDFLMQDPSLAGFYQWADGMRVQKNFDVIEGEYVSKPTDYTVPKDITIRSTYFKEEKGTDVNMAVESLSKAFNNAFDIAIFVSADTDYLPIYRTLKAVGKLVVVAAVKGQYIGKLIPHIDSYFIMDEPFLESCSRRPRMYNND